MAPYDNTLALINIAMRKSCSSSAMR